MSEVPLDEPVSQPRQKGSERLGRWNQFVDAPPPSHVACHLLTLHSCPSLANTSSIPTLDLILGRHQEYHRLLLSVAAADGRIEPS
jgi:hypothetical protein